MKLGIFGKTLAVGGFAFALLAGAQTVSAQNPTEEYREWENAQRRAQKEYRESQRTRSPRDYRDWQRSQRVAQQEYNEYQRVSQRGGYYNNNNGYNDNGYNNNGYNNNGYYNNGTRTQTRTGWYRINRGGSYYEVDQRGVNLLRQAINSGYQQGYNAGVRDRRYNRNSNYYYNDQTYRSGTYGYQSYVARDQYQYYFQQGFQRGYQDGINSSQQYGYRSNTGINVLGHVISSILQIVN